MGDDWQLVEQGSNDEDALDVSVPFTAGVAARPLVSDIEEVETECDGNTCR